MSPKSRPPSDRQTNFVYKIPCADCTWSYIGETSICLHTRKREHIRNTKVFKSGSNVASHAWLEGHTIDFENARVIDRGNSRVRKSLESWHTAITSQADNNAKLNVCQDNIQFYYNFIHVINIFSSHWYFPYIIVFIQICSLFFFFSPLCIYISAFVFYISLFKDYRLAIESLSVFKLLTRENF